MTREEAIEYLVGMDIESLADGLNEAVTMAIEALQGDMYCPNCGVRLVPENEYLEPTQTHGRLIDADALSEKLCATTIFIKDGEVFQRMINDAPTVSAEPKTGEWVLKEHLWECDQCGCRINRANPLKGNIWNYYFCPNCGAIMCKGGDSECL